MSQQTDQTDQQQGQGAPQGADGDQQQNSPQGEGQQQSQEPSWEELFAGQTPTEVREALANSRKWESRAKKDEDAAKKWREHEESQKPADQRSAERLSEAERRATESEQRLMRYEVAAEAGIQPQDVKWLQGSTKEELEASAEEFLARMGTAAGPQQRGPQPDPTQGRGGGPAPQNPNDWMRAQFQQS